MNKLVIETQYLENYGSSENPYMKFKGGSTYVMYNCGNLTKNDIATYVARVKPFITTDMQQSNGGCEEYVIDVRVIPHTEKACADWETVTQFSFVKDSSTVNFLKVTDNRPDEESGFAGWMKSEIIELTESWKHVLGITDRLEYKVEYMMEDGEFVIGQDGLKEWFNAKEAA